GGTYAGPTVGYNEPFDADYSLPHNRYRGSGFHYLTDVERDEAPPGAFAVEWNVRDTWGVLPAPQDIRLRLTMLTDTDEVALADGHPSNNRPGNPERLRYLIARRRVNGGGSRFVSI